VTDGETLDRATKAKHVLDSPAYQQAWDDTRASIIALIEKTPLSDTETAEDLRRCLKLLRDVRANLEVTMKRGVAAQFNLEQLDKRRTNPLRSIFKARA
jgi:hypothetical protein